MPNLIGVGVGVLIIVGLVGHIANRAGRDAGVAEGRALAMANCATEKAEAKIAPAPTQ